MCWLDEMGVMGRDTLIEKFGMTQEEADRSHVGADRRRVFLAIKMQTELSPRVGIIYLDSSNPNAFGKDDDARKSYVSELEKLVNGAPLAIQTLSVVTSILKISPQINIGIS